MAVGGWVERKSGDSGQRGRSQICQYRLLGIRDSPQDVRREENERSWREGEERKERLGVRGTGSRRGCLTATPGAVRVGSRGQGIPPERGQWDLRGCRGGGRAESGEV